MVTTSPYTNSIQGLIKSITNNSNCILLDLDETIFNPLKNWQFFIQKELPVTFTVKDVENAGSMDNYFIHTPLYNEYVSIAEKLRKSASLYSKAPLVDGALEAINKINQTEDLNILGYLSARPMDVLNVTITEIQNNNLPQASIVLRDIGTNFYSSVDWKIKVIKQVLSTNISKLIIIDDNYQLMMTLKKEFYHEDNLIKILFEGPLSSQTIKNNQTVSNEKENFYVANWATIPDICIGIVKQNKEI